ncbi:MAG: hypothetical protein ACRCZS_23770 [Chroococcidiopsis sp.]
MMWGFPPIQLTEGMGKALQYKEIFQLAKSRVECLAELHGGKLRVPVAGSIDTTNWSPSLQVQ